MGRTLEELEAEVAEELRRAKALKIETKRFAKLLRGMYHAELNTLYEQTIAMNEGK